MQHTVVRFGKPVIVARLDPCCHHHCQCNNNSVFCVRDAGKAKIISVQLMLPAGTPGDRCVYTRFLSSLFFYTIFTLCFLFLSLFLSYFSFSISLSLFVSFPPFLCFSVFLFPFLPICPVSCISLPTSVLSFFYLLYPFIFFFMFILLFISILFPLSFLPLLFPYFITPLSLHFCLHISFNSFSLPPSLSFFLF